MILPESLAEVPDRERGELALALEAAEQLERLRKLASDQEAKKRDPWAHRAAGMRCSSCMFFVAKEVRSYTVAEPPSIRAFVVESKELFKTRRVAVEFGRCRRHAPTLNGFPAVYGTDWCGDHKLDEEKAVR